MIEPSLMQKCEITEEDLASTPPRVIALVMALDEELSALRKCIEEQDAKLNRNSSNSSKPPSSDKPYQKKPTGEKTGKSGAKHGHKGHRQALVEPTEIKELKPETCSSCGCSVFGDLIHYYTHQ